ncbi:helix-turn-helix domain-containing protein [Phocaeicola sartorii]|uniref:helix-turn-helix domain-containing protein n=1 Tax=Phocaeicola sartorii TaxID=671267 RepID=UPI00272A18A7|nr:helix-turn-helix transcriptional regulator [Phocaeicola sartorii]
MKDRIKAVRKSSPHGRTQETFAEFLGIPKQNLSSYEIGRRMPSDAVVQLICQKCNIREEWLRTGKEPMELDSDIEFADLCFQIGLKDEKARKVLEDYLKLKDDDKELFLNFLERLSKKEGEQG